jgi:hypothetical protein
VTKSSLNQLQYVKLFLNEGGYIEANLDLWLKEWFWNHRNTNNLRITQKCFKYLIKIQFPIYEVKLPEKLKNRTLIQMSRMLTCCYYIQNLQTVWLTGEEETVMLKLHADNLQQYLDNLELDK